MSDLTDDDQDMILAHSIPILSRSKCHRCTLIQKTKGRILCTEDDADSRELIVFVVTREGYNVMAAEKLH